MCIRDRGYGLLSDFHLISSISRKYLVSIGFFSWLVFRCCTSQPKWTKQVLEMSWVFFKQVSSSGCNFWCFCFSAICFLFKNFIAANKVPVIGLTDQLLLFPSGWCFCDRGLFPNPISNLLEACDKSNVWSVGIIEQHLEAPHLYSTDVVMSSANSRSSFLPVNHWIP